MPTQTKNGGWSWGEGGLVVGNEMPFIQLNRYHGEQVSLEETIETCSRNMIWKRLPSDPKFARYGGHTVDREWIVGFHHPKKMNTIQALRHIMAHEQGNVPVTLMVATYAATLWKGDGETIAPSVYSSVLNQWGILKKWMSHVPVPYSEYRPASGREIEEVVQKSLYEMSEDGFTLYRVLDALDMARMICLISRKIWENLTPDLAKNVVTYYTSYNAALEKEDTEAAPFLGWLAGGGVGLHEWTTVPVNGTALTVPEFAVPNASVNDVYKTLARTWYQIVLLTALDCPPDALHFLSGGSVPTFYITQEPFLFADEKMDIAPGLSDALVRQANEQQKYVPQGNFRLTFPRDYPLRLAGIGGLLIHATPKGLWVSLGAAHGKEIAYWTPLDRLVSMPSIPKRLRALLDVTLCALWRDLVIAGEVVIRVKSGSRGASRIPPTPSFDSPQPARVVSLPRKQYLYLNGELRDWGGDEEVERIRRRAHGVAGHLRRLPDGWNTSADAHEIAAENGVVIPLGTTFVAPHTRGNRGGEASPTEIIHAKGLASVMSFMVEH